MLKYAISTKHLKKYGNEHYKVGVADMQGYRSTFEDAYTVKLDLARPEGQWGYFAIYDGHCGAEVAHFCRDQLWQRFQSAADLTDSTIKQVMLDFDRECCCADRTRDEAGSTAIIALTRPRDDYIEVTLVNVGDSRAFVISSATGEVLATTKEHRPEDETEQQRIEAAGGRVEGERVNGCLAMSRAFGDRARFKDNEDLDCEHQLIVATPTITRVTVTKAALILLCCDGITECLSDKAIVAMIHRYYKYEVDPARSARSCIECALRQHSGDNLSAMIIQFQDGTGYSGADMIESGIPAICNDDQRYIDAYNKDKQRE
jgi:serine/threonine protein phosphatase PrpC